MELETMLSNMSKAQSDKCHMFSLILHTDLQKKNDIKRESWRRTSGRTKGEGNEGANIIEVHYMYS
jgi:hypothetical protein